MLDAVHGELELLRVVVVVVVRDKREVKKRREFLRPPMVQVDGEHRRRGLDHEPHVVHIPYRRPVDVHYVSVLRLAEHLVERRLQPPKHWESGNMLRKQIAGHLCARRPIRLEILRRNRVDLSLAHVQVWVFCGSVILSANPSQRHRRCGGYAAFGKFTSVHDRLFALHPPLSPVFPRPLCRGMCHGKRRASLLIQIDCTDYIKNSDGRVERHGQRMQAHVALRGGGVKWYNTPKF